ncbi:MAG: hypothetical protein U0931_13710 [Vulcanimicrobiota bacterium]
MKKCPFCAEDIQDAAIKCKHCGERLDEKAVVSSAGTATTIQDTSGQDEASAVRAAAEALGLPPGKTPFQTRSNFGCLSMIILGCTLPFAGLVGLFGSAGLAELSGFAGFLGGWATFFCCMSLAYAIARRLESFEWGYCPACLKPTVGRGMAFDCPLCNVRIIINHQNRCFEVPGVVVKTL